nr:MULTISPECIES: ATPase, T2SS/T4P/T4SS family [unclassified Fusobacterium]
MSDPLITEINVNPDNKIFIYKNGIGHINTNKLAIPQTTLNLIQTLASLENKEVNEEFPHISTTLPIGNCRFEGNVPPSVDNPSCSIRKPSKKIMTLDDYVEQGFCTEECKNIIIDCVKKQKNILIVGGTNTGKTTFANAVIGEMKDERLIIAEQVKELQTKNDNNVFFNISPFFSGKQALVSSTRYNPTRIIYGEIRGAEAFDFLNALNSGSKGGLSTIHANDCYGGLSKLETYILYEHENPMGQLIARSVEIVMTLKLYKHKRYLDSIAEVKGYKNGEYILNFIYQHQYE